MGSAERIQSSLEESPARQRRRTIRHSKRIYKRLPEHKRAQLSAQIWAERVKPLVDEGRMQWVAMTGTNIFDSARQDVEEMPPELDIDRIDKALIEVVTDARKSGLTSMDLVRPLRADSNSVAGLNPHLASQIRSYQSRTIGLIERAFLNTEGYSKRLQKAVYSGSAKLKPNVA